MQAEKMKEWLGKLYIPREMYLPSIKGIESKQLNFDINNNLLPDIKTAGMEEYQKNHVFFYNQDGLKISIVIIGWNPRQRSKIHDHPSKGCLMKVLEGPGIEEILYTLNDKLLWSSLLPLMDKGKGINNHKAQILIPNKKIALTKESNLAGYQSGVLGLHKIINPSKKKSTLTLHHYIGEYDKKYFLLQ